MNTVRADQTSFAFRPDIEPVLRVEPGETVVFETATAPAERLFAAGDDWLEALDVHALNAVSGPVYIEGVMPGDAVAVEIVNIEVRDWGFSAAIPGFGLLGRDMSAPMLRRIEIREAMVRVSDRLTIPVRPMIGCLGLAPGAGSTSTLRPPAPWAGNYDLLQASAGNTLLFPAQVPGGLFSLGDLHAAMGAGEATSVSIECAGRVTVRFHVRSGLRLETPRIETPDRLYVIGLNAVETPPPSGDYSLAKRQATALMFAYLTGERGLSEEEAYILISGCVDLEFGGPAAAVVLASVPLAVLP